MPAPAAIVQLVAQYEAHRAQYHNAAFSEVAVRRQFIDPFFTALGWDMNNAAGHAEQYKEVIHEDKVRVGGATKAPDYAFRVGTARKFFVEAKKPAVDIAHDIEPAYQLRRYAWSAKLPLSILTDFEEFSVYDCRKKPDKSDRATTGRILYLTYREYVAKWDEIAAIFSRQAVWSGALDQFAEAKTGKRGADPVDDAFLELLEGWRADLARNLVLRNPTLRGRDINWAVQQLIDRIVFLRICEARDLETFEQLRSLLNGPHTYARLQELFRVADMRYNSGLFHFEAEAGRAEAPDTLTPGLMLDDKVLKALITHLYYPESPYEFSVLPADILGQVYERFLGKVIRLTPGRQVKIEEKPEVRKAGGVFYTPTYIVDYIVAETVGPLLAGKTPGQIGPRQPERSGGAVSATQPKDAPQPLRILDPACGSGSFLLGAYQFLLDWHLQAYLQDPARWMKGRRPALEPIGGAASQGDGYRLTIAERKRILMHHIYGVDIDPQAVEVTKLSLLLKVLEGEGLNLQLSLGVERVLPDLGRNIKCGNSLIGCDFYDGKLDLPDEETTRRVNAFEWRDEFPEALAAGGFDAVIGNPPYIRIQALQEWAPLEVEHYKRAYRAASKGNYDIYVVFVEKGLALLNERGRLGYILPHKFFNAQYGAPLRQVLAEGRHLAQVIHFGDQQVFANATTYTCLLFLEKGGRDEFQFIRAHDLPKWRLGEAQTEGLIPAAGVGPSEWNFVVGSGSDLFERLRGMPVKLGDVAHVFVGTQTSADNVFVLNDVQREGDYLVGKCAIDDQIVKIEAKITKPFLRGKQIRRFELPLATDALISPYIISNDKLTLMTERELTDKYPLAHAYLRSHRSALEAREKGKFKGANWYAFGYPKSMALFQLPKLIVPDYNNKASFTHDTAGHFFKTGYGIITKSDRRESPLYILGLLNSPLLFAHLCKIGTMLRGGFVRFWTQFIEHLPIRTIDFADPADVADHDRMVALVTQMLDLHARLAAEGVPYEKAALQRRIDATDRQIDRLVYALYGLTEDEIAVVEGA